MVCHQIIDTAVTPTEIIHFMDDGSVEIDVFAHVVMTKSDAVQNVEAVRTLTQGVPTVVLIDLRKIGFIEDDARKYYVSEEVAELQMACAMIIDNGISAMVAKFFTWINPSITPLQMFTDKEKGREWLSKLYQTLSADKLN